MKTFFYCLPEIMKILIGFSMFVVKKTQNDIYSNINNLRIVLFINESSTI